MTRVNNPIRIPNYKTREERLKSIDRKTVRDLFSFSNVATAIFVLLDFATLFSKWSTVHVDEYGYIIVLIAISSALILDVPMAFAGKTIIEHEQGLRSKRSMLLIVTLSVSAFIVVFCFSILFSYLTRNATFQNPESASAVNNAVLSSGGGNDMAVSVASLFSGVLPFGTSVASLVISLMTYNPIKERMRKIDEARTLAEEHILHIKQAIAESKSEIELANVLIALEDDRFNQFVEEVNTQKVIRMQAFREALEEECSLDDTNHIIDSAIELNESEGFSDAPFEETYNAVRSGVNTAASHEDSGDSNSGGPENSSDSILDNELEAS